MDRAGLNMQIDVSVELVSSSSCGARAQKCKKKTLKSMISHLRETNA